MTTLRRRLTGLVALLGILVLIVGLPVLLLAIGATPWPDSPPSLSQITTALTTADDGRIALGVVTVLAWASWAFLTLSILLEVIARLRGVRAPHLPGLRLPQDAARSLVSAALLLVIAGATAGPATAAVSAPTVHAVSTTVTAAQPTHAPAATPHTTPSKQPATHTVTPGESLFTIAEEHLGDGERWPEIARLNSDQIKRGSSVIVPGWVLTLPPKGNPRAGAAEGSTVIVAKGDTLSKLALEHLGDEDRWPEIAAASRSIRQPGGVYLTDPDVIDVGWTLRMPTNPTRAKSATNPTPRTATPSNAPTSSTEAPTPAAAPTPAVIVPPPAQSTPAQSTPITSAQQTPPTPAVVEPVDEQLTEHPNWVARTSWGVGALLAAGLVALITRRRRAQQRTRRPGQHLPMPTGDAAELEQQLRATGDPLSVQTIDTALRDLADKCAQAGTRMPAVRAARLTANQFDLFLGEPADLPTPWTGTADATVWTLQVDDTHDLSAAAVAHVPAPYPALVTVGHDEEDGHILLDLEYLGALGVAGDPTSTGEILTALAAELATALWADDLQVTLVGTHPELEDVLQTGRIRYLPTVQGILEDLTARAARDRSALTAAGVQDLPTARATNVAPDAWTPEIVVIAGTLTLEQRTHLEDLVDELPRVAVAAVTEGIVLGEWGLQVSPEDPQRAVLTPIGLHIRPQRIPADQYARLLEVAVLTDVDEIDGTPAPELTLTEVDAVAPAAEVDLTDAPNPHTQETPAAAEHVPAATPDPTTEAAPELPVADQPHTASQARNEGAAEPTTETEPASAAKVADPPAEAEATVPPPRILLLGPVDIVHTRGQVEPTKRGRLLEYAAYLALNPGATFSAIDEAIWPNRTREDNLNTRNTATSKLRRWVGTDPDGGEYLPRHQAGDGYRFTGDVSTDVADWDHLIAGDAFTAATENLEAALGLLRGAPFHGTHPRRYAWAEPLRQRLIGEVVDASYELARRRLMEGRWRAADQAAVTGLQVGPAQESLWRIRILAAHESRDPDGTAEVIDRMLAATEPYECELEPETEQLMAAIEDRGADFDQLMATAL